MKSITLLLLIVLAIMLVGGQRASGAEIASKDITQTGVMADLFSRYNRKLSQPQAKQIAAVVLQAGERFRLDPLLIASIIVRESSARPWAISKGGDYGLMQVRWRVHQKWIRRKYPQVRDASDLLKPEINIFVGAEIFAGYYAKHKTLRSGLLRYSAGNNVLADRVLATLGELESLSRKTRKEPNNR